MSKSRREFLVSSAALLGGGAGSSQAAAKRLARKGSASSSSPPAFGTATGVGPEATAATFAEAEKLLRVRMSATERGQAALNWRESMAPLDERRTVLSPASVESFLAVKVSEAGNADAESNP